MLDVDKQGAPTIGLGDASDLGPFGRDQKAFELGLSQGGRNEGLLGAGLLRAIDDHFVFGRDFAAIAHVPGDGCEHHAIGLIGESAIIGLNPTNARGLAEPQAVGGRKRIAGR